MRFKLKSHRVMTAACLWVSLWLGSCSSQQQEDPDVTASEDSGQGEDVAGENATADEASVQESAEASGDEAAVTQGAPVDDTGAEVAQDSTEGNLKEIISEMDSNTAEAAGDPEAGAALAQQPTAAPATAEQTAAAPSAPGVAALPEMGSKMPYIVEHGDTLGKIAQKVFGNQARWKDIANLSSLANPSRIYPGDVVYFALDDSSMAFAKAHDAVARSQETIQAGDTLAKIAKRVYGTSRSWKHIWRQNDNIDNPDKLTAGTVVYYVQKGAVSAELKKIKDTLITIKTIKSLDMGKKLVNKTTTTLKPVSFTMICNMNARATC